MMERATGVPNGLVRSDVSTVAVVGPPAEGALPALPFPDPPEPAAFTGFVVVVVDDEVVVDVVGAGALPTWTGPGDGCGAT